MSGRNRSLLPSIALLFVQLSYLAILAVHGRFIGGDEIAYKCSGREWANSGRFIASEMPGYGHWDDPLHPHDIVISPVPPGYTAAFGVFAKIFGFSPRTNVLFDALIRVALGWLTFALTRTLGPAFSPWLAALAAAATIPLGNYGRPDDLATALGVLALLATHRLSGWKAPFVCGILYGLALATSLAIALILGILTLSAVVSRQESPWTKLRQLALIAFVALVVGSLVMTPLYLSTPKGLAQIADLAGKAADSSWGESIGRAWYYAKHDLFAGAIAIGPAVLHAWKRRRSMREWLRLWAAPWSIFGLVLLLLPGKAYYLCAAGPFLLAATMIALRDLSPPVRAIAAASATVCWLAASSRAVLFTLIAATLPPSQRLEPNVALVRSIVPPNAGVMTYDFWPALANDYRVYSTEANPDWSKVDFIILTGNGSGAPGTPQTLSDEKSEYVRQHFKVVVDRLHREPFRLGPLHTSSAWGYGPLVLRKRTNDGRSATPGHDL